METKSYLKRRVIDKRNIISKIFDGIVKVSNSKKQRSVPL